MLESANQQINKRTNKEMLAELNLAAIPLLSGALELAEDGWRSSLYPQRKTYLLRCMFIDRKDTEYLVHQRSLVMDLLLDPQTSVGLLVTMDKANATAMLRGQSDYVVIGKIIEKASGMPEQVSINIVA